MRFALHGPMFSGKSTLARDLAEMCGFAYVNYTDFGKGQCALALTALLGRPVFQDEVIRRKNEWRDFIIAALRIYGFDEGRGVVECLESQASSVEHPAGMAGNDGLYHDIVFDNVRYASQYAALLPFGFTLVRLTVSPQEQLFRARRAGMPREKLLALREESSEQPLPTCPGEIVLSTDGKAPFILLRELMGRATALAPTPAD